MGRPKTKGKDAYIKEAMGTCFDFGMDAEVIVNAFNGRTFDTLRSVDVFVDHLVGKFMRSPEFDKLSETTYDNRKKNPFINYAH